MKNNLSLLDWLEHYDMCYSVVASDSFRNTDWFVLVHRKDCKHLVGIHTGVWHSGVHYIDLQDDDTYVDEALQFDLDRLEVKQFYDMMRNGKFLKVHQSEYGIVYELIRRGFKDYCWGMQRRNKKRKKLRYGRSAEALQGNGDNRPS